MSKCINKILICFCCFLLIFASLLGGSIIVTGASNSKKVLMLYDFETTYERANVISRYSIGKTVLSDEHVTHGKKSLYLEISGVFPEHEETHYFGKGYEQFMSNYIKLSTHDNKSFTVKDYSIFDKVSIDIYNASDRDAHVAVYLQTAVNGSYSYYNSRFSRLGDRILLKDKMNLLDFELDDLRYKGINEIVAVYFVFDNIEIGQTPLKLYVDNFHGTKAKESKELIYPTRSNNLFSGFEEEYDLQMFGGVSLYNMPVDFIPYFELSSEYKTEGGKSLKITIPQSNYYCLCSPGTNVNNSWPGFMVYSLSGKSFFQGIDILEAISGKEASKFEIKVDVYNPTNVWQHLEFQSTTFYVEPKAWTTIGVPLTKFNYVNGYLNAVRFAFSEYRAAEEIQFYIDNLRLDYQAE